MSHAFCNCTTQRVFDVDTENVDMVLIPCEHHKVALRQLETSLETGKRFAHEIETAYESWLRMWIAAAHEDICSCTHLKSNSDVLCYSFCDIHRPMIEALANVKTTTQDMVALQERTLSHIRTNLYDNIK